MPLYEGVMPGVFVHAYVFTAPCEKPLHNPHAYTQTYVPNARAVCDLPWHTVEIWPTVKLLSGTSDLYFVLSLFLSSEFVCLQPILLSWLYPHCSEGRKGGCHSWRLRRHFQGEGLQWPCITALNYGSQRWQSNWSLCEMICRLCWVASARLYLDVVCFRKKSYH